MLLLDAIIAIFYRHNLIAIIYYLFFNYVDLLHNQNNKIIIYIFKCSLSKDILLYPFYKKL